MKKSGKFIIGIMFVTLIIVSYGIGRHTTEQKLSAERAAYCRTMMNFAIEKAENEDLTDEGVMRALISNIYAAYQFCDNSESANQLHDLWNYLIFESDSRSDTQEIVLREINAILRSTKTEE